MDFVTLIRKVHTYIPELSQITMKAVVYNKKAAPEKLVYTDVEKPVPGENEVLVKIKAVSVNAADYRSMKMGLIPKKRIFGQTLPVLWNRQVKILRSLNPATWFWRPFQLWFWRVR